MPLDRRHHGEDDADEIEKIRQAKKARKTPDNFMLLHLCGCDQDQPNDQGLLTWTAPTVTSRGVRFQLSLRQEEAPVVSRLLFKADIPADILTSYNPNNAAYFLARPLSTKFILIVESSDDNALLLRAWCGGSTDYYIMDNRLNYYSPPSLTPLPELSLNNYATMGLMRRADDSFAVAGLKQGAKDWQVIFLSTSSADVWHHKLVRLPPELHGWHGWEMEAVLVCGGRFWWLDLRCGLLSCSYDSLLVEEDGDRAKQPPELEFTLLPNVTMQEAKMARSSKYPLARDRCVGVSGGRLRCVEVHTHRPRCGRSGTSVAPPPLCDDCRGGDVTTWVLVDVRGGWVKEHMVKFADVWRDESYRSSGLPKEAPEFPLVHPLDPAIVYLSIRAGEEGSVRVFCVHLGTKQVMSCSGSYKGLNGAELSMCSRRV